MILNDKTVLEPFEYLSEVPGKDFRSKLISAFDQWIHVEDSKIQLIKDIVGMLHTASLLIDDVEDDSELRRGQPVAHKIFGVASTINSANFVYFKALEKVLELNIPEAVNVFTQELLNLHRGQGHEIYFRDAVTCPTQEQYLQMISNKTGGLLRLAVKLMTLCGHSVHDCVPLVDILGMHFQIRDDYINLLSSKYQDTKGFAEDLTEGKFSYPIVHFIQHNPEKQSKMLSILRQRTHDLEVKKYAIKMLEKAGSLESTRLYLLEIEQQARQVISSLGGNAILEEMLSILSQEYQKVF
ncbi:isoprenoid synthase domain-containing protein [Globomyces pollinis-pini]|nr:isoprenoid synthase domain-containing protein [Globomyces pollinis-pini]